MMAALGITHLATVPHDVGVRLLCTLKAEGYHFITPTPATHRRVVARPDKLAATSIRDVLGWTLPFARETVSNDIFALLQEARAIEPHPTGYRALIRVSSLGGDLFMHSAFPTEAGDAVFFGPDTYRFARLLRTALPAAGEVGRLVDLGAGSGAGAVAAARLCEPRLLTISDVNPLALGYASINLAAAGLNAEILNASGLDGLRGGADVIISNPPFIAGGGDRTYRDGGDMLGARLSLEWALEGASRLATGGRFVLYTGSAIIDGQDALRDALIAGLDAKAYQLDYTEIDPDIFGGQLGARPYASVERIAAVAAIIHRS